MARSKTPARLYLESLLAQDPGVPACTLARIAYSTYPMMWKDQEACRGQIRWILGVHGKKSRSGAKDSTYFRSPRKFGEVARTPKLEYVETLINTYAKARPCFLSKMAYKEHPEYWPNIRACSMCILTTRARLIWEKKKCLDHAAVCT